MTVNASATMSSQTFLMYIFVKKSISDHLFMERDGIMLDKKVR